MSKQKHEPIKPTTKASYAMQKSQTSNRFEVMGKPSQPSSSNPQKFAYQTKESRLLLQILEPDHISVYAIVKHFIGDPNVYQERSSEILQNLRCRTLSDFKWYHDVFLAKLMTRADARASFWKERFLYGLSRAFNEKVQESIKERNNGTIPYDELTYGDLISEVKKEGLKLCSQLKLQYQVKKDLKASRKDLGSFCAQYGISMPTPPSQISKKQKPYRETPF